MPFRARPGSRLSTSAKAIAPCQDTARPLPPAPSTSRRRGPSGCATNWTSCGTWSGRGSPQAVAEAAAQGDRSENAEYTYGKKRLHEIDRRVRFLRKRLEGMIIVDLEPSGGRRDPERVYFGAWIQLEHDGGETRWYRLVGPDEFDMAPRLRQHGLAARPQPARQAAGRRGRRWRLPAGDRSTYTVRRDRLPRLRRPGCS